MNVLYLKLLEGMKCLLKYKTQVPVNQNSHFRTESLGVPVSMLFNGLINHKNALHKSFHSCKIKFLFTNYMANK